MPLYEYDCPACGRPFEKRQPMAQADSAACPHCGAAHTRRRLSRIAVKGSSLGAGASVLPTSGGGL